MIAIDNVGRVAQSAICAFMSALVVSALLAFGAIGVNAMSEPKYTVTVISE